MGRSSECGPVERAGTPWERPGRRHEARAFPPRSAGRVARRGPSRRVCERCRRDDGGRRGGRQGRGVAGGAGVRSGLARASQLPRRGPAVMLVRGLLLWRCSSERGRAFFRRGAAASFGPTTPALAMAKQTVQESNTCAKDTGAPPNARISLTYFRVGRRRITSQGSDLRVCCEAYGPWPAETPAVQLGVREVSPSTGTFMQRADDLSQSQ